MIFISLIWLQNALAVSKAGKNVRLFAKNEAPAVRYLSKLPEITVAFTSAPGNGHFAATALVMKRLRKLGFKGTFKIYIEDSVRPRLPYLLPGYQAEGSPEQELKSLHAVTLRLETKTKSLWRQSLKVFKKPSALAIDQTPPVLNRIVKKIGILGGDDSRLPPGVVDVDALLVVQPTGWTRSELRVRSSEASPLDYDTIYFGGDYNIPLANPAPKVKNIEAFVHEETSQIPALSQKADGLTTLLKESKGHDVMTAYGISFRDGPKKLATILNAVTSIQEEDAAYIKNGLVVPMISNFNDKEWKDFYARVQGYPKAIAINDPNLAQEIRALKTGDILLVKTGMVSQGLWNELIDRSTLPPIVAGKTGGAFALSRGKPYINSVDDCLYLKDVQLIKNFHHHNAALAKGDEKSVKSFLVQARDQESQISIGFRKEGFRFNQKPEKVTALFQTLDHTSCIREVMSSLVGAPETKLSPPDLSALATLLAK